MPVEVKADISVIIATRNRAESLRETLNCLAKADKGTLRCEVVVVDNGSTDQTAYLVKEAGTLSLPVHYLFEPHRGKCEALNRALKDSSLGDIVAVLDDDMSPHPDWFTGVKAICDRWPDRDLFTGRSYIIWPKADVPDWCLHPHLRGWAYSVMGNSEKDAPMADSRWFSGNHFWFRSRVLTDGRKFEKGPNSLETHIEMSEPQFMLKLVEDGYRGIMAPDAACGHRIQVELLQFSHLKQRARRVGRGFARARLCPYKSRIKQARLFRTYPLLSRLYCVASILVWGITYMFSWLHPLGIARISLQLQAIERLSTYIEYLHVARLMDEYRMFGMSSKI